MKRRQIRINGQRIDLRLAKRNEIKERLSKRFEGNSDETVDQFVEFLFQSGYDIDDIASVAKQSTNTNRPAVQAFLFHNEHVLDQIALQQGTYTHNKDTAADPNFALRHPAATELIMRRLTAGDLLMLQAAQTVSGRNGDDDRPAETIIDYWQRMWKAMLELMIPSNLRSEYRVLWEDMMVAAATSHDYAQRVTRDDTGLLLAFHLPSSPYYVGTNLRAENRRTAEGFKRGYYFTLIEDPRESCAMTAVVLAAYAIDEQARSVFHGERRLNNGEHFHTDYLDYLNRNKPAHVFHSEDTFNVDQDTQNTPRPITGLGSPREG